MIDYNSRDINSTNILLSIYDMPIIGGTDMAIS